MPDAVTLTSITKTFGPKLAVDDVSLSIPQGQICGIIGPNGAGKTTAIRMIMSIIFPDRGSIAVLGRQSAIESKDRIGYLPEERGLYRKMRVGAFLTFMARLKGVDDRVVHQKVQRWLDRVALGDCLKKRCEELSKGMQQKVQFIAAVLHDPDLLILDEPFSGLDPVNRRLLRELIDEQHRAGRTIIFSTHAMYEAEQLCDHLVMINRGRKVLDTSMHELYTRHDPRTILLEPLAPDAPDLDRTLASTPGVARVSRQARTWELRLEDDAEPTRVLERVAAAVPARKLEIKRVSVEEVFIEIVERSGGAPEEMDSLRSALAQARAEAGAGVNSGEAG